VTDHFQLTTIIATAIRECRLEAADQQARAAPTDPGNTEEDHRIAKSILTALADAGFEICPKKAG
jgi:threonine dehydrogenase-like Zn-dependent dehydrogenase